MSISYYIPESFEKAITIHALKILKSNIPNTPLILGINGLPGEGKTFQCRVVLERLKIKIFSLSAGQFESKDAGEPAALIRRTYNNASDYMNESSQNLAAIIIDDVDVAFGNWGESCQYTVNTQNVIGELMHLADNTFEKNQKRVPIFMTGNDLSKLYAPLRRAGRMDFFNWNPTEIEKIKCIFHSPAHNLSVEQVQELYNHVTALCKTYALPPASLSFYTDLFSHQYDNLVWKNYKNGYQNFDVNSSFLTDKNSSLHLEDLKNLANEKLIQTSLSRKNHLE